MMKKYKHWLVWGTKGLGEAMYMADISQDNYGQQCPQVYLVTKILQLGEFWGEAFSLTASLPQRSWLRYPNSQD